MAKFKIHEDDTVTLYVNGIPAEFEKPKLVEDVVLAHSSMEGDFNTDHRQAKINIEAVYGDHWFEYSQAQKDEKFKDLSISLIPEYIPKNSLDK